MNLSLKFRKLYKLLYFICLLVYICEFVHQSVVSPPALLDRVILT